jgi:hypothetical protein
VSSWLKLTKAGMRWHLMCCHRVVVGKGHSGLVRGGEVRYGTHGIRLLAIIVHVGGSVVERCDLMHRVEIDSGRNGCIMVCVSEFVVENVNKSCLVWKARLKTTEIP